MVIYFIRIEVTSSRVHVDLGKCELTLVTSKHTVFMLPHLTTYALMGSTQCLRLHLNYRLFLCLHLKSLEDDFVG